MITTEPWQMDFSDYVESLGGVYAPFPDAVEFIYSQEWCLDMGGTPCWSAAPGASCCGNVRRQAPLKVYLPENIAVDYPNVPNPFLKP